MITVAQPHVRRQRSHHAEPGGLPGQIRVLVVDDHPAVRIGLRELLEDQPDFWLVDVLATAEAAVSVAEDQTVEVAVVDYQLGGRNGLWLSRKLKRLPRPPRVVIYSAYCDGRLAAASVVAEADGLVSKAGLGSDLCDAIRNVARGRPLLRPVPPQLAELMRRRLDEEEQAIFGMLLARIERAEIAATLGISSARLESRLWTMLREFEAVHTESASVHPNRGALGRRRRPDHAVVS